jgi:hypothetical protein
MAVRVYRLLVNGPVADDWITTHRARLQALAETAGVTLVRLEPERSGPRVAGEPSSLQIYRLALEGGESGLGQMVGVLVAPELSQELGLVQLSS